MLNKNLFTRSEVDDEIEKKDGVADAIEYNPARTEVVVEERNRNGQDDEVGNEQDQHEQVPVEPIMKWLKQRVHIEGEERGRRLKKDIAIARI